MPVAASCTSEAMASISLAVDEIASRPVCERVLASWAICLVVLAFSLTPEMPVDRVSTARAIDEADSACSIEREATCDEATDTCWAAAATSSEFFWILLITSRRPSRIDARSASRLLRSPDLTGTWADRSPLAILRITSLATCGSPPNGTVTLRTIQKPVAKATTHAPRVTTTNRVRSTSAASSAVLALVSKCLSCSSTKSSSFFI